MPILDSLQQAVSALFSGGSSSDGIKQALVEGRTSVRRKNKRAQLRSLKEVPAFYRVVTKIAWDFASVEWTYRDKESGEPLDKDDPIVRSLNEPNPVLSSTQLRALSMQYRDVAGDFVHIMVPAEDENGNAKLEFWPIPPTDVTKRGADWHIDHGDARYKFPDDAVLHEKMPDIEHPYGRGYGYGGVLSDELMTIEHASEFTASQFANSARPDVIVQLAGAGQAELEQFKQMWQNKYGGPKNAGKPLVSASDTGGDLNIETLTPPIKDTKVEELKQMSIADVRKTFGVPPSIVGELEDSNRSSIRTEKQVYAENVQRPRLTQWKRMVEHKIAPLFEREVVAEYEDPAPRDVDKKLEALDKRPEIFTVNEARNVINLPEREDGDVYLRPPEAKLREVEAGDIDEVESKSARGCSCCKDDEQSWKMEVVGDSVEVKELPDKKKVSKQTEDVPPEAKEIAERLQADQIRTELTEEYEGQLKGAIAENAQFLNLDKEEMFTILNPFTQDHVENFSSERIVGINDTTKSQIQSVLGQAIKEGKNPRDIADDVGRYVEDIIPNRGETIARTEMMRSRNAAGFQTQKASGIFNEREWIATLGGRVRSTHLGLNANRKGYSEAFVIPGVGEAMHPGDFGVPGEDINCRCTTMPAPNELFRRSARFGIDKAQSSDDLRETYWRSFDKSLQEQEREFEDVVTSVLTKQVREHILPNIEQVLG